MASNKKKRKPVQLTDQLLEIASEMCSSYCKYPDQWDEEAEGCELTDSEICKKCPLSKL